MDIPPRLQELLKKDSALYGAVLLSFSDLEPWIELSGMPFFPEYTEHGARHITDVLQTASSLVGDTAWSVVTPGDAGMLSIATLLHDCAMHLTEDGFFALVQDSASQKPMGEEIPWPELWAEFLQEASRFDGRKLTALFGSSEPIHRPDPAPTNWHTRDRLLIGEFLRRHHARLAHEIAINGVPGPTERRLRLRDIPTDLANLAGLIARSHGLPLRACLEHLDRKDPREYKGVHPVFLMALLRVADYVQMQAERAPQQFLKVRKLQSPVSKGEWETHGAVIDIRPTHADPEALFVQAAPADSKTYLKLKRLLQGLQLELDNSWAVIGEVFGRYENLSKLGLTIRRVRSNLDDEKFFASTVPYIPCEAKFDAAGADLLKLLIGPLYGDRPEIGIRELMQNAVDACIERKDFLEQNPTLQAPELAEQDADVVITLEEVSENERYLVVSDRGIGMTPSVVVNYFLKAGASFRRSDVWRQQHESNSGQSRVLRSGRFGVGALAAFLLGDEVELSTRHISSPPAEGVAFTAQLDSEEIQLNHITRPVGTTLRVRISSDQIWKKLAEHYGSPPDPLAQWDFYCLSAPSVKRILKLANSPSRTLPQETHLPSPLCDLIPPWQRLSVPEYREIHWTHNLRYPNLICNGIVVQQRPSYDDKVEISEGLSLMRPSVSVFDPDAHLPLSLDRTRLVNSDLPFEDQLAESQCEDFIAWALVNAPTTPLSWSTDVEAEYPAARLEKPRQPFAFMAEGSVLIDQWIFEQISPSNAVFLPSAAGIKWPPRPGEILIPLDLHDVGVKVRRAWFRCAMANVYYADLFRPFGALRACGRRTIIQTKFYNELRTPGVLAQSLWNEISVESSNQIWTILRAGNCRSGQVDFQRYLHAPATEGVGGLTEYFQDPEVAARGADEILASSERELSPLATVWKRLAEQPIIPYDLRRRKQRLRETYKALSPLIEYYGSLKKTKSKASGEKASLLVQLAEIAIHERRSLLKRAESPDDLGRHLVFADIEMNERALCLGAPIPVPSHFDGAHTVCFLTRRSHALL